MSAIEKIKNFFKNVFSKKKIRMLGSTIEENLKTTVGEEQVYEIDKKEIFDIYQKIKEKDYDLGSLNEEQSKKIVALLEEELKIKKDKLDKKMTELNMLKHENQGLENKLNGLAN